MENGGFCRAVPSACCCSSAFILGKKERLRDGSRGAEWSFWDKEQQSKARRKQDLVHERYLAFFFLAPCSASYEFSFIVITCRRKKEKRKFHSYLQVLTV